MQNSREASGTPSFTPKCPKCGRNMFQSVHAVILSKSVRSVPCWKCVCGYSVFSEDQLENAGAGKPDFTGRVSEDGTPVRKRQGQIRKRA